MAVKRHPKWGVMNSEVPPPKNHKVSYYLLGIFLLVVGFGAFFGSCSISQNNDVSGGEVFFMWIMGLGGIFGGMICFSVPKKEMEAWQEFHDEVEVENFKAAQLAQMRMDSYQNGTWSYPEKFVSLCEENGITNVDSERNYQKAKLIAQEFLEDEEIPEEFREKFLTKEAFEKEFDKAAERKLQEKIKKARVEESNLRKYNMEYTSYIGAKKSIAYCNGQISVKKRLLRECRKKQEAVMSGGEAVYQSSKGRESSWALHGGIASGIAGPLAGAAVAMDIERKNADIRDMNNQLAATIGKLQALSLTELYSMESKIEKELKYWENKLEKVKLKLIKEKDEANLLKKLSPQILKVEKSITGNVFMEIQLTPAADLTIYDGVKALVDGSFQVEVYAEDEMVGTAVCALPFEGLSYQKTFKVVCIEPSKTAQEYTAKVVPNHLWAVEA